MGFADSRSIEYAIGFLVLLLFQPALPVPDHHQLPSEIPPALARCYASRGVTEMDALGRRLDQLPTGDGMPGLAAAAAIIATAIRSGTRILIVGDYDADGATAAAVAVLGLRALGAASVSTLVPDRQRHGICRKCVRRQ